MFDYFFKIVYLYYIKFVLLNFKNAISNYSKAQKRPPKSKIT